MGDGGADDWRQLGGKGLSTYLPLFLTLNLPLFLTLNLPLFLTLNLTFAGVGRCYGELAGYGKVVHSTAEHHFSTALGKLALKVRPSHNSPQQLRRLHRS